MKKFFDSVTSERIWRTVAAIALVILAITGGAGARTALDSVLPENEAAIERGGFNTLVHFEQGGGKLTVESGGEVEVLSGGILDVQSGATLSLATGAVTTATIADVSRAVNFPLFSFVECQTNGATAILFTDGTDALPHFANSSTDGLGGVIRFDDTGSSEDEGTEICNQFAVPPDYASGGAFRVRALKNAHTTAESEDINCAVSVNGAALQTAGTITVTAAASAIYTCTPTIAALAVNDSVSFYLSITSETGGAEPIDDTVDIAAVEFVYTATQ